MAIDNNKKVKKNCKTCKKIFFVHPYRKKTALFCSISCGKYKGKKIKRECIICLTRFFSYKPEAKTCSNKCKGISSSGENHSRWIGGCWLTVRKMVLTEQDYTCQNCGFRDMEIMEVNHKLPKSRYPELSRDRENLETLCPNCHRKKSFVSHKNNWLK